METNDLPTEYIDIYACGGCGEYAEAVRVHEPGKVWRMKCEACNRVSEGLSLMELVENWNRDHGDAMGIPIPVKEAKKIADKYGYDQVVIIARYTGDDGVEHVTTYGRNKAHCEVAAKIGDFLKHKIMKWVSETKHE